MSEAGSKLEQQAENAIQTLETIKRELSRAIIGHKEIIEEILICLVCRGHALIEGVPGLGKTYLIKSLGQVLDLKTSRIQFTPDLMPADILGTNVLYMDERGAQKLRFSQGPIFGNIILADEINRATPKTQSALLEAMQEHTVTSGGSTHTLSEPFMVLATQNPIELEGTYPLPEAQLDRFFFKILISYPSFSEISSIIDLTTMHELPVLQSAATAEDIIAIQHFVREIQVADSVKHYAVRLILATHPEGESAGGLARRYVRYGSSPRGAQSLILGAKVFALLAGRFHVSFDDIRRAANPGLRHRIILSFAGEAEGIKEEDIIDDIIAHTGENP
jgi:MoxR-like ATPase